MFERSLQFLQFGLPLLQVLLHAFVHGHVVGVFDEVGWLNFGGFEGCGSGLGLGSLFSEGRGGLARSCRGLFLLFGHLLLFPCSVCWWGLSFAPAATAYSDALGLGDLLRSQKLGEGRIRLRRVLDHLRQHGQGRLRSHTPMHPTLLNSLRPAGRTLFGR